MSNATTRLPTPPSPRLPARIAAVLYAGWGAFHISVAWDIATLGRTLGGLAQGRTFQLAAYMLTIALFAMVVSVGNWRNSERAYWLNLSVIGWADAIWVAVVVIPGYVPALRGLAPPFVYVIAAVLSTWAQSLVSLKPAPAQGSSPAPAQRPAPRPWRR